MNEMTSFVDGSADDEREFDYGERSEKGPARWGELHREWSLCKNGSMQSPIDLLDERVEVVSHLGRLQRNYGPSNATLTNRGHDMMVSKRRLIRMINTSKPKFFLHKTSLILPPRHDLSSL
jgi:carbonic anhydrase